MAATQECLELLENTLQEAGDKIQYQIDGEWNDCEILKTGIDGDYRRFLCDVPTAVEGTITGLRMIDENDVVLLQEERNITKAANVAYSFSMEFKLDNAHSE